MNPNDVMVVVLKDILLCWLGFRFIYIVYISLYYIQHVSNVLLPPTCFPFGLPVSPACLSVSQTSMDDSGYKGNTGQLLNSRVLGVLLVITLFLTQVSVYQSQFYIVCTPPFLQGKGVWEGLSLQINFKKGGSTVLQLLEGGCWERGRWLYSGWVQLSHNKLKSEIINDKDSL